MVSFYKANACYCITLTQGWHISPFIKKTYTFFYGNWPLYQKYLYFFYSLPQSITSHMTISGTHLSLLIFWNINSKYSHRNNFFRGIIHFADTGLWYPPFTEYRVINHIKNTQRGSCPFIHERWEGSSHWITMNELQQMYSRYSYYQLPTTKVITCLLKGYLRPHMLWLISTIRKKARVV